MIEACFKAFARALASRGVDRPGRDRVPLYQGHPHVLIAICDYGMGNLRSVEKALERVGADAVRTGEPAVVAVTRMASSCRESAPFLRRWRVSAIRGIRRPSSMSASAGVPLLGICLGMQLIFGSSSSSVAQRASVLLMAMSLRLDARGGKVPHIGWAPVSWTRESALTDGLDDRGALLLRPHIRLPRGTRPTPWAPPTYGERFACAVERGNVFGVQFHPEKSSCRRACGCSRTSRRSARRYQLDPLPGNRHSRRPRRAADAGRLRARDRVRRRSARRRRALGRPGRRVAPHRRPRRRTYRAVGEPRARSPDRLRNAMRGCSSAVACATTTPSPGRPRGWRRSAWSSEPRPCVTPSSSTGMLDEHGQSIVVGRRRPRRHGRDRGLDRDLRRAGASPHPLARRAGRQPDGLDADRGGRHDGGPAALSSSRRSRATSTPSSSTRAASGSLDDLRDAGRGSPPALGGVIVGRALYEGRFDVADALEALV